MSKLKAICNYQNKNNLVLVWGKKMVLICDRMVCFLKSS